MLCFGYHIRMALIVAEVLTSYAVGSGFAPQPVPENIIKIYGTNYLPAWNAGIGVGVWQCSLFKGQVVCGTIFRDMHYKELLGSITRVGYC